MAKNIRIKVLRAFLPKGVSGPTAKVGDVMEVTDEFGRLMIASGKAEETTDQVGKAVKKEEAKA